MFDLCVYHLDLKSSSSSMFYDFESDNDSSIWCILNVFLKVDILTEYIAIEDISALFVVYKVGSL